VWCRSPGSRAAEDGVHGGCPAERRSWPGRLASHAQLHDPAVPGVAVSWMGWTRGPFPRRISNAGAMTISALWQFSGFPARCHLLSPGRCVWSGFPWQTMH
jgi:hypothetical protein